MTQEEVALERAALDLFLAFETQHADHFSAQLFRLFQKADPSNRRKLTRGFPIHGQIFNEWFASQTLEDFYGKYNVRKNLHDDPIPPELRATMNDIGHLLQGVFDKQTERHMGFMLMVFDLGEGGTTSYLSNCNRDDVVKLLLEFVEKQDVNVDPS